jgi:hypothetical protein
MPPETSTDLGRFVSSLDRYTIAKVWLESVRHLFLSAHSVKGNGIVVFDKEEGTARWMLDRKSADLFEPTEIVNDLDGGPPLRPKLAFGNNRSDRYFITLVPAGDFLEKADEPLNDSLPLKMPELRGRLARLAGSLHEEDNPVVMIVKLKGVEK